MSMKMTVKEYASYRNISKTMVYKYLENGLLSPAIISQKPLLLDVAEADRQLSMNLGPRYDMDGMTDRPATSLQEQRTRLTRINADRKELELQRMRGDLIPTEEAQALWGAVITILIRKFEAIPAKLPPMVHGRTMAEIKEIVEDFIFDLRSELSEPDLRAVAKLAFSRDSRPKKKVTPKKRKR